MQRQKRTGEEGHDDRGIISEIVGEKDRTSGRGWPSLSSLLSEVTQESRKWEGMVYSKLPCLCVMPGSHHPMSGYMCAYILLF